MDEIFRTWTVESGNWTQKNESGHKLQKMDQISNNNKNRNKQMSEIGRDILNLD